MLSIVGNTDQEPSESVAAQRGASPTPSHSILLTTYGGRFYFHPFLNALKNKYFSQVQKPQKQQNLDAVSNVEKSSVSIY